MGPVDPIKRQKALAMVLRHLNLPSDQAVRFEVSFTSGTDYFVARADYAVTRGGGYQIFEGILGQGVETNGQVMGRNRVTPRFPLTQTLTVRTREEFAEAERQLRLRLEYSESTYDDRT